MRRVIDNTSWDKTAEEMRTLIEGACRNGLNPTARAILERANATADSSIASKTQAPSANYDSIILGAGPTGLSAAYQLGKGSLLLDKNATVGGWCRSIEDRGFTFDYAGHIMFSNDAYVQQLYRLLLGDNMHWQDREAWIYSKQVYTRYPFQGALYGLPPKVMKECIIGAIEARFGSLRPSTAAKQATPRSDTSACKAESITDCCADGIAEGTVAVTPILAQAARQNPGPRNFEEFIYQVWGAGVAKHFAIPYNKKLWAVPLIEMETSWLGGRVPMPDLEEMIEGALEPVAKPMGPNARFGYPLRGGFQALMNGFVPHFKGSSTERKSGARVARRAQSLARRRPPSWVTAPVSTLPLPELMRAMGEEAPRNSPSGAATAPRFGALRQPRRGTREHHRKALDLLSGRHGVPPHLRARQCQPALQPERRLRLDLRNHVFPITNPCLATVRL